MSTRPILFQFFEDFIRTHAAGQQLLQHSLCFGLLRLFSGLSICLCLLRFQGCHFFFGLLQSSLLLFQCVLLLFNRFLDGCDLGIQRRNSLLLLCDLGMVITSKYYVAYNYPIIVLILLLLLIALRSLSLSSELIFLQFDLKISSIISITCSYLLFTIIEAKHSIAAS